MIIENSIVGADTNSTQKVACKIEANSVMFDLLSSRLYSDKPLAVIRELSTNALDAHIENNTQDKPFIVHLPTQLEPFFSIRDFGKGMSNDTVMDLFSTMGSSSKRESNRFNGALGIGSKSPFAYTQGGAFTLTSIHEGTKTIYSVYSDKGVPSIAVLGSFSTDEQSGVEVTVPVQVEDVAIFRKKAEEVYRHFKVKPHTNIRLENLEYGEVLFKGDGWAIFDNSNQPTVVMASVGYPIDTNNLKHLETLKANGLVIFAKTGEVQMAGSRESLSYTKETIEALTNFNNKITKEILDDIEVKKVKYENNLLEFAKSIVQLPGNIRAVLAGMKLAPYLDIGKFHCRIDGECDFEFVYTNNWGKRYGRSSYITPSTNKGTEEFILDDNGSKTNTLLSKFNNTRDTLMTIRPLFPRGKTKEEKEETAKKLEAFAKILGVKYKFASVKYDEIFGASVKTTKGVSTVVRGIYKATGLIYEPNKLHLYVSRKTYELSEESKHNTVYIPFDNKNMVDKNWETNSQIFDYSEDGALYAVKDILTTLQYSKTVRIVTIPISKKAFANRAICVYDFLEEILAGKPLKGVSREAYNKTRSNVRFSLLRDKYNQLPKDFVELAEVTEELEKNFNFNFQGTNIKIKNFGITPKTSELTLSEKNIKALNKYSAIFRTVTLNNTDNVDNVISLINAVDRCSKTRNKVV
jgi:hypothetical protein